MKKAHQNGNGFQHIKLSSFERDRLRWSPTFKRTLSIALISTATRGDAMYMSPTIRNLRMVEAVRLYIGSLGYRIRTGSSAEKDRIAVWVQPLGRERHRR